MGFSNNLSKCFFSRYSQTRGWSTTLTLIHYNIFTILYLICTIKVLFVWAQNTHQRCGDILSRVAMERTLETNVINSLILFLVYYINNKLQWKICNSYISYCPIFYHMCGDFFLSLRIPKTMNYTLIFFPSGKLMMF